MPLLALQIKEILVEESNVQPVNSPVTVSRLAPVQLAGSHACHTTWRSRVLPAPMYLLQQLES